MTTKQNETPRLIAENDPVRCPHCGRRATSDFDEDVGMWYECENCDYRWMPSSAPEIRGKD